MEKQRPMINNRFNVVYHLLCVVIFITYNIFKDKNT
jgi:hypothetical protein